MPFALPLREVVPHDVAAAGGKGANLAALVRAGLPVPPGFVVSAEAYERVVAANDLQDAIEQHAQVMLKADATGATEAAAAIRARFMAATLPDTIAETTLAAYRELGAGAVAVRSSATAEDLPAAIGCRTVIHPESLRYVLATLTTQVLLFCAWPRLGKGSLIL